MSDFTNTRRGVGLSARAILAIGLLVLGLSTSAVALPIVEWDLANATGQTAAVLSAATNTSATAIAPSGAITAWSSTAQDGFIAASGWGVAAPDAARYYEWTVSADAGFAVDYQSITLALFRGIQGGTHGAEQWDLRASTDGFAASNIALQTLDISGSAADQQTLFSALDISALGTVAGTVTFRLYGYDYTQPADFSGLGNDSGWLIGGTGINPLIDGSVVTVVPEPGTALLVGLGLIALGVRRRT
jgi:hypothetical protein